MLLSFSNQFPSPLPFLHKNQRPQPQCPSPISRTTSCALPPKSLPSSRDSAGFRGPNFPSLLFARRGQLQICRDSSEREKLDGRIQEKETLLPDGGKGGGGNWSDWSASIVLFGLWAGLMYYVFQLAPNQTPYRDTYFLQKLLNLRGDDGFRMNEVLVALWYVMGLWPIVYSMLLLPTGRSSRRKVPVWPFAVLSFFGGAYVLIPYFILWKPPPPAVEEDEINRWPLNILESKITAGILLVAGLGLIAYAGLADGDVWKEFFQYFRESKFIHITCLDFSLLSTFSPFWVYNDMSARRWMNKGSWLLPVSLIPFLGPALYLLLRPPLSALLTNASTTTETE